jgi:hypothetical protein
MDGAGRSAAAVLDFVMEKFFENKWNRMAKLGVARNGPEKPHRSRKAAEQFQA